MPISVMLKPASGNCKTGKKIRVTGSALKA